MGRSEEYRRYAAECIRVAKQATDLADRTLLLEKAERWRDLADRVQRQTGADVADVNKADGEISGDK